MGISSYTRVCNLLIGTDDFKAYVAACERIFANLEVTRYEFNRHERGRPFPKFYVTAFGVEFCRFSDRLVNFGSSEFRSIVDKLHHPGDICEHTPTFMQVFEQNLGTKVKTFNCSRDKIKLAYRERGMAFIDELFRERINLKISDLNGQAANISFTDKFIGDAKEAYDRQIIDEVKQVLLRFKDAEPAVLKTALDEFVTHDILET